MKYSSKTILLTSLFIVIVLGAFYLNLNAQQIDREVTQGFRLREEIVNLDKIKTKDRVALLKAVGSDLKETQAALVSHLDSNDPEVRFYAVYLLGRYRLQGAVTPLAEVLTLEDKSPRMALWYWDRYPAVDALIRIGKASVPPMIEVLETSQDVKERKLALMVLRGVEGVEVSRFVLQQAVVRQKDEQPKERLQAALKDLQ